MNTKIKKALKKKGMINEAALIKDRSGTTILEKMHEVAE
jgi:hypothetical protein